MNHANASIMEQIFSKQLTFTEGNGYLHGFSTGTVKVKSKFRTAQGGQRISKLNVLRDQTWTPAMPILVWVIDHPEGVWVVDTGENARVTEEGYFKKEGPVLNFINTRFFHFEVKPAEEVGQQLAALGYQTKDIRAVVLTHLHLDHFDGLKDFENTPIMVHQLEWEKPSAALPSLYPEWFEPIPLKLTADKAGIFDLSHPLTDSGEIKLVHTPGHTLGHCSVLVQTTDLEFFLAGDVTYNQAQLEQETLAGAHQHFKWARQTMRRIKQYATQHRLIYLPSHDEGCLTRLSQNQTFGSQQTFS